MDQYNIACYKGLGFKAILLSWCLSLNFAIAAQTGQNNIGQYHSKFFIEGGQLQIEPANTGTGTECDAISNDKGDLLFYVEYGNVYDKNHKAQVVPATNSGYLINSRIIKLSDSNYCVLGLDKNQIDRSKIDIVYSIAS